MPTEDANLENAMFFDMDGKKVSLEDIKDIQVTVPRSCGKTSTIFGGFTQLKSEDLVKEFTGHITAHINQRDLILLLGIKTNNYRRFHGEKPRRWRHIWNAWREYDRRWINKHVHRDDIGW